MTTRWYPVADRPSRTRARHAIRELAAILSEPLATPSSSLALGDAGTAVFFAYLGRTRFPIKHATDRARFYARRAAGAVGQTPMGLGLFGGVAGIAWMLQHLRGIELPRVDLCADVGGALRMAIDQGALDDPDLVTGLCGTGIYAIARRDRALATAVVARLRARSVAHGDGVLWKPLDSDQVDLGTAHGLAGIAAMLSQASAAKIPGAATLSRRALRCLLGHARWALPSVFPDRATVGETTTRDCRLAWCYGDIGVACALHTAGEVTGNAGLCATAMQLARHAAARSPATSGVVDCGICHGAAGAALGLQRMFVASGDPALRDAARGWLARALDYGIPEDLREGAGAAHGRGLLGGAGLGLAYLAATTTLWPRWCSALTIVPATARRKNRWG